MLQLPKQENVYYMLFHMPFATRISQLIEGVVAQSVYFDKRSIPAILAMITLLSTRRLISSVLSLYNKTCCNIGLQVSYKIACFAF